MALQKQIPTRYGINAEYWKVSGITLNFIKNESTVILVGYYNQQTRTDGAIPVASKIVRYNGNNFPFTVEAMSAPDTNPIKIAYTTIKDHMADPSGQIVPSEFSDAVDC